MVLNFFADTDFQQASPPCHLHDMKAHFMHRLDVARYHSEIPYIVNSAYRTVEHEKEKGRNGKSSHTKGLAVDLEATTSRQRSKILHGLIQAGFTRIGIGEDYIHVDLDEQKDQNVIWHYYKNFQGKETGNSMGI